MHIRTNDQDYEFEFVAVDIIDNCGIPSIAQNTEWTYCLYSLLFFLLFIIVIFFCLFVLPLSYSTLFPSSFSTFIIIPSSQRNCSPL